MKRQWKSNTRFFLIALVCLFILTGMILPLKEENRLKLIGDERIVLKVNDSYIEEGVTYKGNDVTNQVVIKSDIDTNQVGTYQVHYTYQTEKGKTMTMIREVKVTE